MKKLTYGMVGGGPDGFIGDAHRRSIALDDTAELVAGVFSRSHEKSLQMAEKLGIDLSRHYTDYQEMAEAEAAREDGIDFVVITTPNYTHYEIAKAFLNAGIHVSCEKPVATSSEQAEELEALAKEKGLLFMVTYIYTGHVTTKYMRDFVMSGEIGEVRTVMAEYPQGWLYNENDHGGKQGAWRCDPAQAGRVNCLGDLGTHVESMIRVVTDLKIRKVLARMDVVVPGRTLDDNDQVLVEFENGATGMIWASQFAIGCDNSLRIRIFGSKGSIFWFQENPEEVVLIHEDGIRTVIKRGYGIGGTSTNRGRLPAGHTEGWLESMANLYDGFAECVRAKKDGTYTDAMIDYPSIDIGVGGLKFVEACLESNEKGNVWVEL